MGPLSVLRRLGERAMLAKVHTSTIFGLNAVAVDVETRIYSAAKMNFSIIGLGDTAVRESRERVLSALKSLGFSPPEGVILVNLAPAEIKKEGSSYDLPIAIGILAALGKIPKAPLEKLSIHGELALDGSVKPVRGAVAMSVAAIESGKKGLVIPQGNYSEASLVAGIEVLPIKHLSELVQFISSGVWSCNKQQLSEPKVETNSGDNTLEISDVWGQESAKRAMVIAAAGGHNMLMIGPPGCGKSMLAARFSSLLPPLSRKEQLEVVRIHSIAAQPVSSYLKGCRPYRAPHHLVSDIGLIGGGAAPRPGEISLAHRGALFLDEFPEFRRSALESLRAPLEAGAVSIARARGSITFPAEFQLIAAMNPCPCGRLGVEGTSCLCPLHAVSNYLRRLSQPILDRIDLHVELEAVPLAKLGERAEPKRDLSELKRKISWVRRSAEENRGGLNATLQGKELLQSISGDARAQRILNQASQKLNISARGAVRILRIARTIADLDGSQSILAQHVAEAVSFRAIDRLAKYAQGS